MYYLFSGNTMLFLLFITVIYVYINRKQQPKKGKKRKEKKELSRTGTRHLVIDATTPNHYTTKADYVITGKVFNLMSFP